MRLKSDVRIQGIRPETVLALVAIERIYSDYKVSLVLTSCIEGKHRRGSLHYIGHAIDIRLPPVNVKESMVALMKANLGQDFDVVTEGNHIHIEFQPKKEY